MKGRPTVVGHQIPELEELGESKVVQFDLEHKQVKSGIYHYNQSKTLNPKGKRISYRSLGDKSYLLTLVKKGS